MAKGMQDVAGGCMGLCWPTSAKSLVGKHRFGLQDPGRYLSRMLSSLPWPSQVNFGALKKSRFLFFCFSGVLAGFGHS